MGRKISLALCNDVEIPRLAEMYKSGKIKAGEGVKLPNGKTYFVTSDIAYTRADKEIGDVRKHYVNRRDGWHLQDRQVSNERGSYHRGVGTVLGTNPDEEFVSLGGQSAFVRQPDGTYFQPAFSIYPAREASSAEIEAAIDYIKGKGSAENYTRLLRNYQD